MAIAVMVSLTLALKSTLLVWKIIRQVSERDTFGFRNACSIAALYSCAMEGQLGLPLLRSNSGETNKANWLARCELFPT